MQNYQNLFFLMKLILIWIELCKFKELPHRYWTHVILMPRYSKKLAISKGDTSYCHCQFCQCMKWARTFKKHQAACKIITRIQKEDNKRPSTNDRQDVDMQPAYFRSHQSESEGLMDIMAETGMIASSSMDPTDLQTLCGWQLYSVAGYHRGLF